METDNATQTTGSTDLGVRDENAFSRRLEQADNSKERAFLTANWVREHAGVEFVDDGRFYVCHDGIWQNDGEQTLYEVLEEHLREESTPTLLKRVKHHLRGHGVVHEDEFGTPEGTVAVENDLLNLESGQCRPLQPDDRATWQMPGQYDPNAECPIFEQKLEEWVSSDREREKLQEFVGYALDDSTTKFEKMLLLLGPTDSGKTVFLDVVEALFGEANVAHQSIQYIANQRWGIDKVAGKPVNIRHDLDARSVNRPGVVKELASGNPMKAEKKGGDPYEVRPIAKHLFSANRVPEIKSPDDAFYNRWLTVVFPNQIPREEQDRDLVSKLTTPSELSGILNWAIEGYQRLQSRGYFSGERPPDETRALWNKNGGSIERFIHEHLELVPDEKIPKEIVYVAYQEFAESLGATPESQNMLTRKLKSVDGVDDGQRRFNSGRKHAYIGVKLTG